MVTLAIVIFLLWLKESAKGAVEIARKHFPQVKCKWGDEGLNEIIQDSSIVGVAVVVAGQTQVSFLIIKRSFFTNAYKSIWNNTRECIGFF